MPDHPPRLGDAHHARTSRVVLARVAFALSAFAWLIPRAPAHAQEPVGVVIVHVTAAGRALPGATVRSGRTGARTDTSGTARLALATGRTRVQVRNIGFRPETVFVDVVAERSADVRVALRSASELAAERAAMADMPGMEAMPAMAQMGEVRVTATRSERRVDEEPLRVEVMEGDMLAEQTQMRPRDITMMLAEMGGVRMQQTSGSLGGTRLRINGLRGQYSGMVFDGLPLFGASPDGFSYLQVAPLDLRQVEVIKGAATALYGPSALGGVLNLVSRRPDDRQELLVDYTTRGGSDVAYWKGVNLSDGWGWSLAADAHRQPGHDEDGDGWADFPSVARMTVRPRLHHEAAGGAALYATLGVTAEDRAGGFLSAPAGAYTETMHTARVDAGLDWHQPIDDSTHLVIKASIAENRRDQVFGTVNDRRRRLTAYTEVAWSAQRGSTEWVLGAAWQHDELRATDAPALGFAFDAPALIAQHTWTPGGPFATQVSARCDAHNQYGLLCSPRGSVLWKPVTGFNARLSAGEGWFAPTPLTDESDAIGLARIDPATVLAERARTLSLDLGGSPAGMDVNLTLALSRIDNPVLGVPVTVGGVGKLRYVNAAGPATTRSVELFASKRSRAWTATAMYGYLDATFIDPADGARKEAMLVPRHALGLGLAWAGGDGARVSLDAFYTGAQRLDADPYRTESPAYTFLCLLWTQPLRAGVELCINAENLADARQTRFDALVLPAPDVLGRRTTQVWAPLEGRVVNFGVRVSW
ncbi:MAG: TonB-dependent receptor [Gemmatimonadetes bacterium]|nr:TonB-dependent receptor [Gemmatimonadota bacterium]